MKALKTILTAVFLLYTVASFAQTKEETEEWLNEKFNKYNGSWLDIYMGQDLYWHTSTFDFQLKDGYLTVKESFRYKSYYSERGKESCRAAILFTGRFLCTT